MQGLPADTSPDAGLALLRERKDLLSLFDEWQKLSLKSKLAAEAISQYDRAVSAEAVALGVAADTSEALESALWKLLTAARQSQVQHDQLAKQIQEASGELDDAQALAAQSERALNDLIQLAGLTAVAEMEPLLAQDAARFLRLRLATHLLQRQIERFREENQGPLARAAEEFEGNRRAASTTFHLPRKNSNGSRHENQKVRANCQKHPLVTGHNEWRGIFALMSDWSMWHRQNWGRGNLTPASNASHLLRDHAETFVQARSTVGV